MSRARDVADRLARLPIAEAEAAALDAAGARLAAAVRVVLATPAGVVLATPAGPGHVAGAAGPRAAGRHAAAGTAAVAAHADAAASGHAGRGAATAQMGGAHAAPWERSGTLHDSIGYRVQEGRVVVGSTDPVAVWQEAGTMRVPPRPFLAPTAAALAPELAAAIGAVIGRLLR